MSETTGDLIYDISQSAFSNKEPKDFASCSFNVEVVNRIKNIPVIMEITIEKIKGKKKTDHYGVSKITSSKIFYVDTGEPMELYCHKSKLNKFSPKEINNLLSKLKTDMEKFKFDKLTGKFIKDAEKITANNIGIDIFGDNYLNCAECCVCYEKTCTLTDCSHNLCVECWSNVKKKECPLCRKYLHINEYAESDEEN